MSSYHLTFDVDWAPDWSVRETLEILREYDVRATFFITHPSETVEEIAAAGHEVGIHPNFAAGSTQGDAPVQIVESLMRVWPLARVMRTYGLHQSSRLFQQVVTAFPQLEYDLSILTQGFRHVGWFEWRMPGTRMRRMNYNWEDDVAFEHPEHEWGRFEPLGELMVLDFHPIHVSLNCHSTAPYDALKRELGARPLTEASRASAAPLRDERAGTYDYLRAVLASPARPLSFEELVCVSD